MTHRRTIPATPRSYEETRGNENDNVIKKQVTLSEYPTRVRFMFIINPQKSVNSLPTVEEVTEPAKRNRVNQLVEGWFASYENYFGDSILYFTICTYIVFSPSGFR